MPIFIVITMIQIVLVVHVIKTGRNAIWIWVLLLLPLVGMLAYVIVEILPELLQGRTARRARKNLGDMVNPNRDIKQAAYNYSVSDTVENSMALAEECMARGMYGQARDLYQKCLTGMHENDPELLYGLAAAEFELDGAAETRRILDRLIEHNPAYKNANAHLLYARALLVLGEADAALHEFEVLDRYFSGPQASYYYAELLRERGDRQKSDEIIERILRDADISGHHYKAIYTEWLKKAKALKAR